MQLHRNAQVQVWLAPVPIQSCVGAIANRGQWEQGCSLFMATDLGPVRATRRKKKRMQLTFKKKLLLSTNSKESLKHNFSSVCRLFSIIIILNVHVGWYHLWTSLSPKENKSFKWTWGYLKTMLVSQADPSPQAPGTRPTWNSRHPLLEKALGPAPQLENSHGSMVSAPEYSHVNRNFVCYFIIRM